MAKVDVDDVLNCTRETIGDGEFYLSDGSGDEYFEVLNENDEKVREGEVVLIGRGDRVRVNFDAFYMSAREYAEYGMRYVWAGILRVDEDGLLVLPNGQKRPADGSVIDLRPENGNCMKFGRTDQHVDDMRHEGAVPSEEAIPTRPRAATEEWEEHGSVLMKIRAKLGAKSPTQEDIRPQT